ncbi:MAG: branched-chain amino acid ABC transporter permease [Rhodobacteraceae bacterium]|nr:branched-chain amino acid ABC transporter permease [Paracoccaceae bacterium]
MLLFVGLYQSWNLAAAIFNLCLISAIMSLGVNIQWGYAGLFNVGIMGFAALGGVAAVLVSAPPVAAAWRAGGQGVLLALGCVILVVLAIGMLRKRVRNRRHRVVAITSTVAVGYFAARHFFDPATLAIEKVDPAATGFLGGLGLPIIVSWLLGGLLAGCVAWAIGRITLNLRSDYLAIATLGISEIIIAVLKNEDWLTRGVKNVIGLPRPVPYEIELQREEWFIGLAQSLNAELTTFSSLWVKVCYALIFLAVLVLLLWLCERALNSPWGRMMRCIRDNEEAAHAMGKDIVGRRLQVFVLGSMVIGVAGAMLTTLDGQFTPGSYQPMRFTFLIWVMVIVGGSANNWGSILGGFLIWFVWVEAEPVGGWLMDVVTSGLATDHPLRTHLLANAAHTRLFVMGVILLLVLRFFPRGLIPER